MGRQAGAEEGIKKNQKTEAQSSGAEDGNLSGAPKGSQQGHQDCLYNNHQSHELSFDIKKKILELLYNSKRKRRGKRKVLDRARERYLVA